MNVLSLFDGISCGQVALNRCGIKYDNYYASEIDENAIKVTQHNYPNTIQLGSVIDVKAENLPSIDLLIGGSPCQGFSYAGKQLNFQDERSKLFFEFVRLKNELKPKYFFLENVHMSKVHLDTITFYMGRSPIKFDSALVSAQSRKRYYWTNIPFNSYPEDKRITFQSILTSGYTDKLKSRCLLESDSRPNTDLKRLYRRYTKTGFGNIVFEDKNLNPEKIRVLNQVELERLQTLPDGYTSILDRNSAASCLGNGWNVDTICHFFNKIKK